MKKYVVVIASILALALSGCSAPGLMGEPTPTPVPPEVVTVGETEFYHYDTLTLDRDPLFYSQDDFGVLTGSENGPLVEVVGLGNIAGMKMTICHCYDLILMLEASDDDSYDSYTVELREWETLASNEFRQCAGSGELYAGVYAITALEDTEESFTCVGKVAEGGQNIPYRLRPLGPNALLVYEAMRTDLSGAYQDLTQPDIYEDAVAVLDELYENTRFATRSTREERASVMPKYISIKDSGLSVPVERLLSWEYMSIAWLAPDENGATVKYTIENTPAKLAYGMISSSEDKSFTLFRDGEQQTDSYIARYLGTPVVECEGGYLFRIGQKTFLLTVSQPEQWELWS